MSQHQTNIANLLREIVAYCREAGHEWSNLSEAEAALATHPAQAQQAVAHVEDWPDDRTPIGVVWDVDPKSVPIGTKLYPSTQDQAKQAGEVAAYITTAADGQIICRHKGRWPHDQWVENGWRPLTYADTSPPPAQPAPSDEEIDRMVYEHAKLNPNQADDKVLLTGVRRAVRALLTIPAKQADDKWDGDRP